MHCSHCGKQIENDSTICSFCNVKIDPVGQTNPTQQPAAQVKPETISILPTKKSTSDKLKNAFLVFALADFGFSIFLMVLRNIASTKEYGNKLYELLEPVAKPLGVINSSLVLFFCFLYSKKKEHKTLFLILAICLLAWNVYNSYLKTR